MRGPTSIVSPSLQCTSAGPYLGGSGLKCASSSRALGLPFSAQLPSVSQRFLKAGRTLRHGGARWSELLLGQNEDQSLCPQVWCRPPVYCSLAESRGSHPPPPKAVALGSEQRSTIESAPLTNTGLVQDKVIDTVKDTIEDTTESAPLTKAGPIKDIMKDTVEETEKDPIEDPIKDPMTDTVKNPIKATTKDTVEDTAKDTLKDPIKDPITDPFKNPIKESIKEPIKDSIKDKVSETAQVPCPRMLLIGVGTAGGKMVRHIASGLLQSPSNGLDGMEVWAMNTDAQALRAAGTEHQLQLGEELMKGLGTGGDSTLGVSAAEASAGSIAAVMAGPPGVCYVVFGAGGGTGGGASPLILRAARAAGHLAVGVITLPFRFEGQRRLRQSQATMAALQTEADMVCAIDQDAFLHQQQSLSMTQAAEMAASMALRATQGITSLIQAEAAHLSGQAISLHGALPPVGVIELLRGAGRTVVAHGTGATAQSAIHVALQAPQLGSLDMFAGSLVCVLSSATAIGAAHVADALTRLRGCTGGNSRRVVLATCQKAGTQAVGANIILTGLPHELLDVAPPSRPASSATLSSRPIAATPSPINEEPPAKARQGSSESVPSIRNFAEVVPSLSDSVTSDSAVTAQKRGDESATSSVPSSSVAVASAALSHSSATGNPGPKDGARLPPAGGKIVIISAGRESWDGSPGEGPATDQKSVGFVAPIGLEPYSSPLDMPRGQGLEPYSSPLDIPRGQETVPSQQLEPSIRRSDGRLASVVPAAVAPEQANRARSPPLNGARGHVGQAQAPPRRAPRGATVVPASRADSPSPSRPTRGTARSSSSNSPSGVRGGKVERVDETVSQPQPAALPPEYPEGVPSADRIQAPAVHVRREGLRSNIDRRGIPQAQQRGSPRFPTGNAATENLRTTDGRRMQTETEQGATANVSAPKGGSPLPISTTIRTNGTAQLSRAVAANAAALAWWREVVEEPSERLKAAAEEQQQQQQNQRNEEDGEKVAAAELGSVSSRARAILARERHEEQYRLVRVKQVLPDGSVYEGQMAGTGPHGQGQCVYPNGDVYDGDWRLGVRHGVGRLTEASGDVYDGAWRGGHRHGQGRVEYAEGHVLSARFVDGHVHGPAIIAFGHGSTFYGAFRFNRRQGVAMTVHADGQREWEVWEHGQRVS